ncbi:hypothetical protein MD484_g6666, partial [Candolleomyces efflorescens]
MSGNPTTTTEEIVANADYHSRLLQSCSQVEYAPAALKQHDSYIKDLQGQLTESDKKVEALAKVTKKERKEHEKIRDSTARRFAAKLSGKLEKFEANQVKEENGALSREYVEALQSEMVERDQNAVIQQLLTEARSVREELVDKSKKYESFKAELDSLYSRIFDGPSESFPEEDRLEYDAHAADKQHQQAQTLLNTESQAAELLSRAVTHMERCQVNVKEALGYSEFDLWSSGSMADLMERNALTNAKAQASQAQGFVEQARRVNPIIPPLLQVDIASGSWATDVLFDNPFTDYAFHEKIKRSGAQVLLATNRLKEERQAAVQRAEYAGQQVEGTAQRLENTRKELFQLRKALFESVASNAPRPPSYDKVIGAPPTVPPKDSPPAFPSPSPAPGPSTSKDSTSLNQVYPPPAFPPPNMAPSAGASTTNPHSGTPSSPSGRQWGSRNPYAAQLLSQQQQQTSSRDEEKAP